MAIAPQQNWSYYESRVQPIDADWFRSLSVDDRFRLYEDMYVMLLQARQTMPGDWGKLDLVHWNEKLALRRRMNEAFSKMDELRRERAAASHAV